MDEGYHAFLETADERFCGFAAQAGRDLTESGCKRKIKLQKSGYPVSCVLETASSIRSAGTWPFSPS